MKMIKKFISIIAGAITSLYAAGCDRIGSSGNMYGPPPAEPTPISDPAEETGKTDEGSKSGPFYDQYKDQVPKDIDQEPLDIYGPPPFEREDAIENDSNKTPEAEMEKPSVDGVLPDADVPASEDLKPTPEEAKPAPKDSKKKRTTKSKSGSITNKELEEMKKMQNRMPVPKAVYGPPSSFR